MDWSKYLQKDASLSIPPLPDRALPARMDGFTTSIPAWSENANIKESAVMLLFVIDPTQVNSPASLLLTRRATTLRSHRGQIGFPGGRRDKDDCTPIATALRETAEEIGIAPDKIAIVGGLRQELASDKSIVFPIVGLCRYRSLGLKLNPHEVDEVLLPKWHELTQSRSEVFSMNLFGIHRASYLFRYGDNNVWGLTAKIIYQSNLR